LAKIIILVQGSRFEFGGRKVEDLMLSSARSAIIAA